MCVYTHARIHELSSQLQCGFRWLKHGSHLLHLLHYGSNDYYSDNSNDYDNDDDDIINNNSDDNENDINSDHKDDNNNDIEDSNNNSDD